MSFAIPRALKELNSLQSPLVLDVELNDVDIDRMVGPIMELAVKHGRRAASRTDTSAYETYFASLTANENLRGFDNEQGREVLDGWLRASVVKMERGGLSRGQSRMGYLRPITIATYASGMPKLSSRQRKADVLAYSSMLTTLRRRGVDKQGRPVAALFRETFGLGVEVGDEPWDKPRYDGRTSVDIDALLALRFIEGFGAPGKLSKEREVDGPSIPEAVQPVGQDLVEFLSLYGPFMAPSEAFSQLSALLSLRLFQLPLISARALRRLLYNASFDSTVNTSAMYCDFVRRRGSASDELSRLCVQRDLELMRTFFRDRLLIRSLEQAAELAEVSLPEERADRLPELVAMRDDPALQIAFKMQVKAIKRELDKGDTEAIEYVDEIASSDLSPADQLVTLLVAGLSKSGLEKQVKWFWSTGGITKPYGVLVGHRANRASWRYAPTDEAMSALVSMCFVDRGGVTTNAELPMKTLLERLRTRFGIWIDRPPVEFDSADARGGAAANLAAFTRQLQLMGCFRGLSDDFSAQFVSRPRESRA